MAPYRTAPATILCGLGESETAIMKGSTVSAEAKAARAGQGHATKLAVSVVVTNSRRFCEFCTLVA